MSPHYKMLVTIANNLKSRYLENHQEWEGSPFEWIKGGVPSRTKGKVGEEIVRAFLTDNGFSVTDSPNTDSDLTVNGKKVEVKMSTLWTGGFYRFQQIRQQDYDVLFCLGISPRKAYAWATRKSDIVWDDMDNQHGGSRGSDTWWMTCHEGHCPHAWMRPQNGDLAKICSVLQGIITS